MNVIGRKRPPEAESVTAVLATRSLQFLRELDPVFDVDFYQTVGIHSPTAPGSSRPWGTNIRQILVPPTQKSIEAALVEARHSPTPPTVCTRSRFHDR